MRQTFRQEEAEQILRDAVRREAEQPASVTAESVEVSKERLQAMAQELGISPAALEAVLRDRDQVAQQELELRTDQQLRREFITERHAGFFPHLYSYLGVNGMLFFIWLMTHGGYPWFLWPMLGWGLGLYLHGMSVLPTRGAHFEHEFTRWKDYQRRQQEKEAAKQRERDLKELKAMREAMPSIERERDKIARRDAEAELDR